MTRASAAAARIELEDRQSPNAILGFLTVTHPALVEPIRVVSDVVDYLVGDELFTGIVFDFKILTDGEGQPRTQLIVQNIDRRIGQALLAMNSRAMIKLEIRSSADFDLSQSPRVEIGSAAVIYGFRHFELVNVQADALQISGDVQLQDYSVEPWPFVRATQSRLPGLFR